MNVVNFMDFGDLFGRVGNDRVGARRQILCSLVTCLVKI